MYEPPRTPTRPAPLRPAPAPTTYHWCLETFVLRSEPRWVLDATHPGGQVQTNQHPDLLARDILQSRIPELTSDDDMCGQWRVLVWRGGHISSLRLNDPQVEGWAMYNDDYRGDEALNARGLATALAKDNPAPVG